MSRVQIKRVQAREVYWDRMKAAVMVTVTTEGGAVGKAVWSPGLSVGTHEPLPLYDKCSRFGGFGLKGVADYINRETGKRLVGLDVRQQAGIDGILADEYGREPGIAGLAPLSSAVLDAAAREGGVSLYRYVGGERAFVMPVPAALVATGSNRYGFERGIGYKPTYSMLAYGFDTYREASEALWNTYMNWYDFMRERLSVKMQPIAGMAIPPGKVKDDFQLWEMMAEVIDRSGYHGRIGLQADMAANCFYNRSTKRYEGLFSREEKNREEMIEIVLKMAREYPFVSVEDPLMEDDFEGFAKITEKSGIQIIGDDLVAGRMDRLKLAAEKKACNCIRLAVGQVGTFSQAIRLAFFARENNMGISVCGERGDGIRACDYAVGLSGGTAREYGMCYSGNRLSEIEREIGPRVKFYGREGLKGTCFSGIVREAL